MRLSFMRMISSASDAIVISSVVPML